jgi:sphingomyelin phosphodiesterase acid-like 3
MSDILFDPLADPVIIKQLIARPAAQWQAIFASSTQTGYTHSPNDTNYPFAESALSLDSAQNPFDFVIALGDYLWHDFQSAFVSARGSPSQFPGFATKAAIFVVDIQAAFAVPVYLALGNGDSTCGDYRLAPGNAFLAALRKGETHGTSLGIILCGKPPAMGFDDRLTDAQLDPHVLLLSR